MSSPLLAVGAGFDLQAPSRTALPRKTERDGGDGGGFDEEVIGPVGKHLPCLGAADTPSTMISDTWTPFGHR